MEMPIDVLVMEVGKYLDNESDLARFMVICKSVWLRKEKKPSTLPLTLITPPPEHISLPLTEMKWCLVYPLKQSSPSSPPIPWLTCFSENLTQKTLQLFHPFTVGCSLFKAIPKPAAPINRLDYRFVELYRSPFIGSSDSFLDRYNTTRVYGILKLTGGYHGLKYFVFATMNDNTRFSEPLSLYWWVHDHEVEGWSQGLYETQDFCNGCDSLMHDGKLVLFHLNRWMVEIVDLDYFPTASTSRVSTTFPGPPLNFEDDNLQLLWTDGLLYRVENVRLVKSFTGNKIYTVILGERPQNGRNASKIGIVYKLTNMTWSPVSTLRDEVLFLGYGVSFSCPALPNIGWCSGMVCLLTLPPHLQSKSQYFKDFPAGCESLQYLSFQNNPWLQYFTVDDGILMSPSTVRELTKLKSVYVPPPAWLKFGFYPEWFKIKWGEEVDLSHLWALPDDH